MNAKLSAICLSCHENKGHLKLEQLKRIQRLLAGVEITEESREAGRGIAFLWDIHNRCPYGMPCAQLDREQEQARRLALTLEDKMIAVAIASELAKSKQNIDDVLLSDRVFSGINGDVRFYADGTNKHNLKVFEVTAKGPKEVSETSYQLFPENESFGFATQEMPQIYGKDEDEVKRYILSDI